MDEENINDETPLTTEFSDEELINEAPEGKNPYIYDEMSTEERDKRDKGLESLINDNQ